MLNKEKITLFYKDITLNSAMEELALIRKELWAIGTNINQITNAFHSDKRQSQAIQVSKVISLYRQLEAKTDNLLLIVNRLAEEWLPSS